MYSADHLALLNAPIVTAFGVFRYFPIDPNYAKYCIANAAQLGELDSYIGHESTAKIISDLTGVTVATSREEFNHAVDQYAIVFKLRQRQTTPRELTVEEIEAIGYDFGVLYRMA